MLSSKANKIFIDEILPLVTKAFSSITAELMAHPQYWDDEDEEVKKLFEDKGKMFISYFRRYVEGTINLQYEILCTKPIKEDKECDESND